MMQSVNISLLKLMEGMSEVFIESKDSYDKHLACESEHYNIYNANQMQTM